MQKCIVRLPERADGERATYHTELLLEYDAVLHGWREADGRRLAIVELSDGARHEVPADRVRLVEG